ncbi:MAG: ribosome recycling factor [SAR324 cluster bacterium]|uniref:Ribosome-recycling factor n=1 Tax=SAR324 cluster bacterium TaxID=2024889 RepID=A0A7X9IIA8_9DELT|nr:ribosome recycling factor [SAR324 cluster bacterium]
MTNETKDFEQRSQKAIEHFKKELSGLRTGRASVGLLEGIMVDYYGSSMHLNQLGLINAPEARLLTIQVYDKGAVEAIEKAILASNIGLNPQRDGQLIRLVVPALTEERRKELVKNLHKIGEETKITIRNLRRDCLDLLKKAKDKKEIPEDDFHKAQEDAQKITDRFTAEVDKLVSVKEKEMMEV